VNICKHLLVGVRGEISGQSLHEGFASAVNMYMHDNNIIFPPR